MIWQNIMGLFKPNIYKLMQNKDAARLIKALSHRNDGVRERAAAALGMLKETRAVDHLVGALKDAHWLVRIRAAQSLGQIGDGRAVDPLVGVLSDVNLREAATKALAEIVDDRSVNGLIRALKTPDVYVRWTAAAALGQKHDPRAVGPLICALKDDNLNVRESADNAIKEIGLPADPTIQAQYAVAKQDWDKAVSFSGAAAQPLINALKENDSHIRERAGQALAKIGAASVAALSDALRDEREQVRIIAAEALFMIGAPAVEALVSALKDKSDWVRAKAARTLGAIGDSRAVESLRSVVGNATEQKSVRQSAAIALNQIGDESDINIKAWSAVGNKEWRRAASLGKIAYEPLIASLKNDDGTVCHEAVAALGEVGDERAVEPIVAVLLDSPRAADALVKIGKPSVEPLISALRSGKYRAAETLVKLYHGGNLDDKSKQKILAVRDKIEHPHSDISYPCNIPHEDSPGLSL
jgi:HEAT repeat protein